MQEVTNLFKKALISGNIVSIHNFLKNYQHADIANWVLDNNGCSALHYLSFTEVHVDESHRKRLAHLLLEYGANVNLKDKMGVTPLSDACELPCEPLVELFIKNGADVRLRDDRGQTALFSPVLNGEIDIVDNLLEAGANTIIDVIDKEGDAAIHGALENEQNNDVLNSLIAAGANLNIQNGKGRTLLHLSVLSFKNIAATRLLLQKGADYLIEDVNGVSALQIAAKKNFYPFMDELVKRHFSHAEGAQISEDCVEDFKIILLENPSAIKPTALILFLPFDARAVPLSNRWDAIRQELQRMKDTKIGDTQHSFYDILRKKDLAKNVSNYKNIIEAINVDDLKDFPNFLSRIEALKFHIKKIDGFTYSIYDIYTEKDENKLAEIFLNKELESKVGELINSSNLQDSIRKRLKNNLEIGVKRRDLLHASLDYYSDRDEVKHLPPEMTQKILKSLYSEQLSDIALAGVVEKEKDRGVKVNLVKSLFPLLEVISKHTQYDKNLPQLFSTDKEGDLFFAFKKFDTKQPEYISQYVKENLPLAIHDADDFCIIMENLNAEQRAIAFNSMIEKFPSIIWSADDFYFVLSPLSSEQRTVVFNSIMKRLPSLIHNARDFYFILKPLNSEQRTVVFNRANKDFSSITLSADVFYAILKNLNAEQRTTVFKQVNKKLPSIIYSADDVYSAFKYLNTEQRATLFEKIKEKLPSLLHYSDDFYIIFENLNAEQRVTLFDKVEKTRFSSIYSTIRCSDDFYIMLQNLNAEQRATVFDKVEMEKKLLLINNSAHDFCFFIKNLNIEQRKIMFDKVKESLPLRIRSAYDFFTIIESLDSEQRNYVFERVKESLPFLIMSRFDFVIITKYLNSKQCAYVLERVKESLLLLIRDANDYLFITQYLKFDQIAYIDKLLGPQKDNIMSRGDSRSFALEECLAGSSSGESSYGRRKRNVVGEEVCQFSWKDVDKFNAEKEKPREVNEIKINSDQYIATLEDPSLSETKQAQLFKFPERFPVVGSSQERVNDLIKHQKNLRYLHKVGRLSGMATQGMMIKNTLRDFFQGDYEDVAINIGFIAGGQGFAKMAVATSVQGKRFIAKGQRLLGQSLRVASPFLARGTSVFIAYDLVEQIKAYKKGNPDAAIGMLGDGIYLGVDGVEIGIEIAEGLELLEGVSSITGPIGATIGAVVFIGTDIYSAVKLVDKIDEQIHLTGIEKLIEGSRAFLGMRPEPYIEKLLQQKQVNNELFAQGLAFLKSHPTVQRIIFPTVTVVPECITKFVPKTCQPLGKGAYGRCSPHSRIQTFDPGQLVGRCTSKLKPDLDNIMLFEGKKNDIKWSRVKPDVTEGNLFCFTGGGEEIPSDGAYFCDKAMGIEYSDSGKGNTTIIQLGDGDDVVIGFPEANHIVTLGNGRKSIRLGNGNDIFLLEGSDVRGALQGGGGTNILDLGSFAKQKKYIAVDLKDTVGYLNATIPRSSMNSILYFYDITDFFLRPDKQDFVHAVCNPYSIDGRGGENQDNPDIIIISENYNCTHALKFIIRPYTRIINHARNGQFNYIVPYENKGENTVDLQSNGSSKHRFAFDYTLHDIGSIKKIGNILRIAFLHGLTLSVTQYDTSASYQFRDQIEIKARKDNLYVFQNTSQTIDEILGPYSRLASHLKLFFVVRLSLTNESMAIGHGEHEVLHNDPYRRSHLIGNGGENVFVISSGREVLDKSKSPIIPEVVLYDLDRENLTDTLDLRQIRNQLEKDLGLKTQLKTSLQDKDILIGLFSSTDLAKSLVTVRLKDALRTDWYKRLHIIFNHAPMELLSTFDLKPAPLAFGPYEDIIMINSEDIEENTKLVIFKKAGDYRFYRMSNNLIISNAFANNLTTNKRYTVSLQAFYQEPKLETLALQFSDREIVLKNEMVKIEHATDFAAECEQYNRTMYDTFFNKNARQENSRPARHIEAKAIEKPELNKNGWGIISSHVLPIVGAIAAVFGAGMGYRYQARNRLRANRVPAVAQQAVITVPLLTPTIAAKSSKQQEKMGSNSKESYSEQKSHFTQGSDANMAGNVSLLRCLFHFLGWDSVVARINQAESVLASANDSMTPLDLIEQSVKKAIGSSDFRCAPKSNGTNWATKKNTASFFQANVASTMDHKPGYKLIGLASGT